MVGPLSRALRRVDKLLLFLDGGDASHRSADDPVALDGGSECYSRSKGNLTLQFPFAEAAEAPRSPLRSVVWPDDILQLTLDDTP